MADLRDQVADLYARARDTDIEAVAGVKLFRSGRRLRGECPLCGSGKGKRSGGAFSVDPEAGLFKCFACGEGGDVIDLERGIRGGTMREAAERMVGAVILVRPRSPGPLKTQEGGRADPTRPAISAGEKIARETWGEADRAILDTPVARYLRRRRIPAAIIAHLAEGWLRYHPAAKWAWDGEARAWIRAPAMVARLTMPDGGNGHARAVHVTYLQADGRKAALDPAKRMWGPQKDADGRPGGAWLTSPLGEGPLIVAEGIESALSAWALQRRPCRVVATLSLGALQGGWLVDKWGRLDPAAPRSDPERPAFTWEEPTTRPWGEVLVAVDRDMSPIEVKVRKLMGGTGRRRLDAEERARICAGLAVAAWKRAGANVVRAIAPAAGRDFNDELVARLAAGV